MINIEERSSMDCLFCSIVAGEIPAKRVFEDEHVIVFRDISPQAPAHLLIIPRAHIASLDALADSGLDEPGQDALLGRMHRIAAKVARSEGLDRGYRTVINTGPDGGQTVSHLHVHLLGGRAMHWPPG